MSTVSLPPSLSDRIDAVNVLLSAIGESPVSSVDDSEAVDVAGASNCLDEFDRAVQTRGWPWNREVQYPLAPDTSGEIHLPVNCLSVVRAYPSVTGSVVVERSRKLYDRTNRTFLFDQPVKVDMVVRLAWDELPEVIRRYITIWAAQQFQGRVQTSLGVDRILQTAVDEARAECGHKEDEAEESNSVWGNAQVSSRLNGRLRRRPN